MTTVPHAPAPKPARRRRIRLAGALAAITLAAGVVDVAVLPSDSADAAPVYWNAAPSADRISVIGDSVMAAIRWYGTWQPLRSYNYVVDVESCRRTTAPSCRGREGYQPDTTLNAMRRLSGQLGSAVVIGTGYDDPGATFANSIDAVMAEAARQGVPVVIWATMRTADVTYVGPTYASNASTFRDNNRILLGKAAQYGGRLLVADWATYSASRPDWVTRDGIHLTPSGATAMAQFIANQAAAALPRTPSAPTLAAQAVGPAEVVLSWTAPAFTGRSPIVDYGYQISPDGGATWTSGWAGPASERSTVIGGLTEGGHYQFRLTARNAEGWGALSTAVSARTMLMIPSAPTLSASAVGANEIQLSWTAPAFTGGAPIVDYGYQISPDGGATWTSGWAGPASERSTVIGGLAQGGHYQFRLTARNAEGWGALSTAVSARTMAITPSAPTLSASAVGANEIQLSWTAPAFTGDGPIVDYGYQISPDGGATWTSGWAGPASERSTVIGGLAQGGHYQFRLTARNAAGWGALSTAVSARTMAITPSAPTLSASAVGANEIQLSWTAPASTGDGPIVDYGYQISPDGGATWTSGWAGPASERSTVIGGLAQGGHYQFRLTARNAAGWGALSTAVSARTMAITPSAPTLSASAVGANEIQLSWTAPASTGDGPIVDYGYQISSDGGASWVSGWAGPASERSTVIGGLAQGGHYQFRLTARNVAGWGALSTAVSAIAGGSFDIALQATNDAVESDLSTSELATPQLEITESTTDSSTEGSESSALDSSVGDFVWLDADFDGVQDADEQGLEGFVVRLIDGSGAVVDEDVSDSQGRYELASPSSGSSSLEVVVPAGYQPTIVNVGLDESIDSDVDPSEIVIGSVETTVRVDLDETAVDRLNVDLDIGLVLTPDEPTATSTTTTTTTSSVPTTETTTAQAPTTTASVPATQAPTTAVPQPTDAPAPPTEPPATAEAVTTSSGLVE